MKMRKAFASKRPKPPTASPPQTTPDNKRTFDMRPKPSDDRRREDPRDRAIRPRDDTPEQLLDPDPSS